MLVSPKLVANSSYIVVSQCCTCVECFKSELVQNWKLKKKLRIVNWGQYLSIRLVNNTKLKYIYLDQAKQIFHYTNVKKFMAYAQTHMTSIGIKIQGPMRKTTSGKGKRKKKKEKFSDGNCLSLELGYKLRGLTQTSRQKRIL